MKSFKQYLYEKIYDYEVKKLASSEIGQRIIKNTREAMKSSKDVGFRSDPSPSGTKEITHLSQRWERGKTGGLAGQGHIKSETQESGVHYTPISPEHDDHEILRRALGTWKRYRSSDMGRTSHNFHIVIGNHDHEAQEDLNKRRTKNLHPSDAREEIEDYPEGIMKNPEIHHTIPHKEFK